MASITCGACKSTHSSAILVRNCYGKLAARRAQAAQVQTTTTWAKANQRSFGANEPRPTVTATAVRLATDNQINYAADLMVKLNGLVGLEGEPKQAYVDAMVASRNSKYLTFDLASETIDHLKGQIHAKRAEQAAAPAPEAPAPAVPDGRYAIVNEAGVVKFYKVSNPTEGRWAGRTFVDALASDERHPIRDSKTRDRILRAIAEDVHGALVRYGREIGACGVCGRTLTDETSRANGIGPVCAAKL